MTAWVLHSYTTRRFVLIATTSQIQSHTEQVHGLMVEQDLFTYIAQVLKGHETNNCMSPWKHVYIMLICISVVLMSTMIYSLYQIFHLWERLSVTFKGSRGITCRRTLRQWNGNFPQAISTAFIPACASYFLSSSARFLLCHSYCSSITIVPSLLKRDIVHCRGNIQSVSSHPRMSSQEWHTPRNEEANNRYFKV